MRYPTLIVASALVLSANAFAAASSPYAAMPLLRDEPTADMPVAARVVIVLLALLAPLAWWLRRRRGGSPVRLRLGAALNPRASGTSAPVVRCVTRLNGATSLYVVEWESQSLLIACAGEQVNVLERSPLNVDESARSNDKDSQ